MQEEHPGQKITVITGMALGYDQALALAALEANMHVVAALPHEGQEKVWRNNAQREYHSILERIRESGGEIHTISPGNYNPAKMQARNEWMVDRAGTVLALHGGRPGGTANCVDYAREKGREIVNIWREYEHRVIRGREQAPERAPATRRDQPEPTRSQRAPSPARAAGEINVVHIKDHLDGRDRSVVYVGRRIPAHGLAASPLANGFQVGADGTREEVAVKYRDWLRSEYAKDNSAVRRELFRIRDLVLSGRDVSLAVWRSPQEEHVETVREAVSRLVTHEQARQQVLAGNAPDRETPDHGRNVAARQPEDRPQSHAREQSAPPGPSVRAAQAHHDVLSYNSATDNYRELFEPGDGRNRAEHASYLNGVSKTARDAFEHGAGVYDGVLVVPKEFDSPKREGTITSREYAVDYLSHFVENEQEAREKAAELVQLGEQICGSTSDSKARIGVFQSLYEQIGYDEQGRHRPNAERAAALEHTLEGARVLAEEMARLEPQDLDRDDSEREDGQALEFEDYERGAAEPDHLRDESEVYALAYEDAVAAAREPSLDHELSEVESRGGSMPEVTYERIDLGEQCPALPDALSPEAEERLLDQVLPEVDRRIEAGEPRSQVLAEVVYSQHRAEERADKAARVARAFASQSPEAARNVPATRAEELQALTTLHALAAGEARREAGRFSPGALDSLRSTYAKTEPEERSPRIDPATTRGAAHPGTAPAAHDLYVLNEKDITLTQGKMLRLDLVPTRAQVERIEGLERAASNVAGAIERMSPSASERAHALDVVAARANATISSEQDRLTTFERASATRDQVESRLSRPLAHDSLRDYLRDELAEARDQIEGARSHYLNATGHAPDTPEQARASVATHVGALKEAAGHVVAERDSLGQPPRAATKAEESHVFVSLNHGGIGNDDSAHRLPVDNLREHRTITRLAEACGLHVNTWYGLHGREITGRSEAREQVARFVGNYIDHRMRDSETRAINQSSEYREYAGRLDSARSVEELRASAKDIRRENYQLSEQHKAHRQDPEHAPRPERRALGQREMSQLFLSPAPRHYTSEMRDLRHNLSATGRDKDNLVRGLERGDVSPSKNLSALLRELDGRRSPEAVSHFVRCLTKPAAEMDRPSSFDLHAVHKTLLPYEKDYLFRLVNAKREEIRERQLQQQQSRPAQERTQVAGQRQDAREAQAGRSSREVSSSQTFRTYYAEATWQEAVRFTDERARRAEGNARAGDRSTIIEGVTDRHINAVGYVIHNTDARRARDVASHLMNSSDRGLRAAGEILDAFNRVQKDERADGRVELSLTTPEKSQIGGQGWSRLLEHLHPDRPSENSFLRENLPESHVAQIRQDAQRGAWQEIEAAARPASYTLDTRADVLYRHAEFSESLANARQQQERARTAHHALEGHVEAVATRVEKELSALSPGRPDGRGAERTPDDRATTRDLVRAALDPRHAAARPDILETRQRDFELVRDSLTRNDRERYDGLSQYSDRSKDDYLRSMGDLDEKSRALTETRRQDEAVRGASPALHEAALTRPGQEYQSHSREQYLSAASQRESELLTQKLEEMIQSGPLPPRGEGAGGQLVRDLIPEAERQALAESAREEAWQVLVPEELRGGDSGPVGDRVLDQAVEVEERISGARDAERELGAAREALAAYDSAARDGHGEPAARSDLSEHLAAAESRFDRSFAEIDREQAMLEVAREEEQLESRAELFETLREPLEGQMRDYLDRAFQEEGHNAFTDPEHAEEHAAALAEVMRDCMAEHGLTPGQLSLKDRDVDQIAHDLVSSLGNTLDRTQAHALHEDVMRGTPERGTEHLSRAIEAFTQAGNEQFHGDFAQDRFAKERDDRESYEKQFGMERDGGSSQARGPEKEHEEATRESEQIEISRDAEYSHDLAFLLH
ncbi:MAG: DNA-processing protein DprA [Pyrinomonadaceae bacterium]